MSTSTKESVGELKRSLSGRDVEAGTAAGRVINRDDKVVRRILLSGGIAALVLLTVGVIGAVYGASRPSVGGSTSVSTTVDLATSHPTSDSDGCAYQGKIYPFGKSWRCCDGCNICTCDPEGRVFSTEKACDAAKYLNTCSKMALDVPPPPSLPSPPPPSPSPAPAIDDDTPEMEAPDPALIAARNTWLNTILGGGDGAESSTSSVHITTSSHPAVVPASDETMAKVEMKLNEKLMKANEDVMTRESDGVASASSYGFAILEQNEDGAVDEAATDGEEPTPTFKETNVNIDEDPALAAKLEAILPNSEGHSGSPVVTDSPFDALVDPNDGHRQLKVIGPDGRQQVSCGSAHGNQAFYQIVAFHSKGSNWAFCSGTLIAPDVVLTAGHCIYDKDDGGWQWPDRVSVRSCSSSDAWRTYKPRSMMTWNLWMTKETKEYDIGLVKLHSAPDYNKHAFWRPFYPKKHAGDLFGWKSVGWHTGMTTSWNFRIAGYPGDKQRAHGHSTMWWDADRMCTASDKAACRGNPKKDYIRYQIDTAGGQSGSGVFHWGSANGATHLRIYAVHANGWYGGPNGGPRTTRAKVLQMCSFISNSRVC
jgi:V8-like Glu-specific endopeptidase